MLERPALQSFLSDISRMTHVQWLNPNVARWRGQASV